MSGKAPQTTSDFSRFRVIYATYLFATLDVSWMFLQMSVTPYLAKRLGFDTLWFGYLQTMVGVIQLLGGPIFGRFADLFGARTALSLSCVANTVFFGLLVITNSPIMLFIQKLPTLFMHGLPGAQMVVADLTEPANRASALAKIGLCFGIGMITGSTLGGTITAHYGETFTSSVAVVGSLFNLGLVLHFIPKSTKAQAQQNSTETKSTAGEKDAKSLFDLGEITRLMKYPNVARTFLVKSISGLPAGIFQVMFSIIAINVFELDSQQNGYLMAYFGILQMFIQGGVIGRLTSKYDEWSLLLFSIGLSSAVGLAQAFVQSVFQFCFIAIPMMLSLIMFNVVTDSMLTKSVPQSDTGTMLGLCASEQSLLRTVGPTIGGFMYENYGFASFGLVQFVLNTSVFTYLFLHGFKEEHKE